MHIKRKNKKYLKSLLLVIIVIGVVFISYKEVLNNKDVIENKINIARNESSKESMVFQRVDGCCESINYIFELAHEL